MVATVATEVQAASVPSVDKNLPELPDWEGKDPPDIVISPLPNKEVLLIVLIFVPETNASCFPDQVVLSALVTWIVVSATCPL